MSCRIMASFEHCLLGFRQPVFIDNEHFGGRVFAQDSPRYVRDCLRIVQGRPNFSCGRM